MTDSTRHRPSGKPTSPSARPERHERAPRPDRTFQKERAQAAMPASGPLSSRADQYDAAHAEADDEVTMLSGVKPVLELLEQDPARIDLVLLKKGRRNADTDRILDLCRANNVRFSLTDAAALDRACPTGHQGIVARLFSAGFVDFETMLDTVMDSPLPLIVALDQVQDAGNAGTFARTLYALGGAGLVIPRHNGVYLGSGARRAAAGALEHLPVARVTNMAQALDLALERGFTVYASARDGHENEVSIFETQLRLPAILVLGSEEKGLRPLVLKRCQQSLFIPMLRDFDSLNVAQAGGILVSQFLRQRIASTASTLTPKEHP